MAECPSCGRPLARPGPRCFYCNAPLGAPARPEPGLPAAAADAATGAPSARLLVVLDLAGAGAGTLGRALRLGGYDAELLARRGGFHLHRVADPGPARAEVLRLAEEGLMALLVPESEARTPPLRALAGEWTGSGLALRTEAGELDLRPGSLLLVVTGEIVREYQPRYGRQRPQPTRAGHGWLAHLHRRGEARAVEIDPEVLGVDGSLTGSARLEAEAWIRALAPGVPRDDGFRWLPPALAAAAPDAAQGPVAAAGALASRRGGRQRAEPRLLLDNREQFRFYSGWRGGVERLRQS